MGSKWRVEKAALSLTFCNSSPAFNFLPEFCTSRLDSLSAANLNCNSLTQQLFFSFPVLHVIGKIGIPITARKKSQVPLLRWTRFHNRGKLHLRNPRDLMSDRARGISSPNSYNKYMLKNPIKHNPPSKPACPSAFWPMPPWRKPDSHWEKLWRISFPLGKAWGAQALMGTTGKLRDVLGHLMQSKSHSFPTKSEIFTQHKPLQSLKVMVPCSSMKWFFKCSLINDTFLRPYRVSKPSWFVFARLLSVLKD